MTFGSIFMLYLVAGIILWMAFFFYMGWRRHRQIHALWMVACCLFATVHRIFLATDIDPISRQIVGTLGPFLGMMAGLIYWLRPCYVCKECKEACDCEVKQEREDREVVDAFLRVKDE